MRRKHTHTMKLEVTKLKLILFNQYWRKKLAKTTCQVISIMKSCLEGFWWGLMFQESDLGWRGLSGLIWAAGVNAAMAECAWAVIGAGTTEASPHIRSTLVNTELRGHVRLLVKQCSVKGFVILYRHKSCGNINIKYNKQDWLSECVNSEHVRSWGNKVRKL